jgi:putative transcriptional regulator
MKCTSCDARLTERVATREQPYAYVASGLADLQLIGIKVRVCPVCHFELPTIPRPGELHRLVTLEILHKPAPLTGTEVRFMRKDTGLPQGEFAALIGFTNQSHLCRVEAGTKTLSDTAERLARVCVAAVTHGGDEARDVLLAIGKKLGGISPTGPAVVLRPVFEWERNQWRVASASSGAAKRVAMG